MARSTFLMFVGVCIVATYAFPHPGEDIITQPKPGEEYVFVQTSGSGARPIARKDKHANEERPFETAHKLPPSLTYALNHDEPEEKIPTKSKPHKREANPADAPAPAPAGAIKLDVQKLLEKYKTELKTSTTQAPKRTTKNSRRGGNKRTKKEAKQEFEVTSASPVLTTGAAAPKKIDDDIPLVASGSEKQRSRIQIKKAPNGQEYEYEYVYYYYDDDEDDKKVTNAHDGPARGQTSKGSSKSRGAVERTSAAPEANEVVPSSRGKTRGRQLGEEEVGEERLPANTRFPPRSRNLNTTPLPEEEAKATRGRGRGRPTTEAAPSAATEADNVSDETQGSRGRTRANVRRPSLELVDNASFNTHPGSEPSGNSPSFPTDLPAGPVRFLGATPNESVDPPEPISASEKAPEPKKEESATETETSEENGTTVMSPMDKVALDLYAILQGTQKLSGEDVLNSEENSTDSDPELTTLEITTEQIIETTTPTTTTTTTTTTTPAPTTTTTTTTEASSIGRGRFKGRGRKTTHAAASTTEAAQTETKPKSKFSRPSFGGGRHRPNARTTPEPAAEQEAAKEEVKPASHSRPTLSRSRFGATRTRTRTTAAPAESQDENASSTSAPSVRPSLTRPRSSFNLRTRGRSTPAPDSEGSQNEESASSETVSTTARTRRIQAGSGVRPLRPGPRINLARGRPGQSTTTTTEEPVEDHVTGDEEQPKNENPENSEEKEPESSPAPVDNSPLGRLRNKHRISVQPKPKAAASTPVQVRRVNPLLARRRPGQTTEASSSEAPQESASTEAAVEEENEETEAPQASSTTTEEPRGLNKLLAGRRRLATRPAAHH